MGWLIMNKQIKECNDGCCVCEKPVTEGQKFYYRGKWEVVHAICEWEE